MTVRLADILCAIAAGPPRTFCYQQRDPSAMIEGGGFAHSLLLVLCSRLRDVEPP